MRTPPPWKQFYVFLATALTGVLTAGTAAKLEKQIDGKGVAQLRELLPHNYFEIW